MRQGRNGQAEGSGPWLLLFGFDAEFWRRPITERIQKLGRHAPDADIVLPHSTISRVHAEIWRGDGQVFMRDLCSTNGVFVNGRRVTQSVVAAGDTIRLGSVPLRVVRSLDQDPEETPHSNGKIECLLMEAIAQLSDAQRRVFDLWAKCQ